MKNKPAPRVKSASARSAKVRLAPCLTLLLAALASLPLPAQKFTVLYNFAGPPDGGVPYASLIDENGVLYGTTEVGGTGSCTIDYQPTGCGTVFKVNGKKETVLYSFQGEPDGAFPIGGLVQDKSGNLYGTTSGGGTYGYGVVFKITGKKETVLYSFKGAPDGVYPSATLVGDAAGNLYGTTYYGGANLGVYGNPDGGGTIFKLSTNGNETVLYSFCSAGSCTDGANPHAGLIIDAKDNLYGTTVNGGNTDLGTVFKLDASGSETVLYSFCPVPGNCSDGANPEGGLVMDTNGNFYGTTYDGGVDGADDGNVFKLAPNGTETVLHAFCSQPSCADGKFPIAGLIMDAEGNLYGTTLYNTAFELDASGAFSVLHTFTQGPGEPQEPIGGLVMNAKGTLFGTASEGGTGSCDCGAVFKLKP